MESGGKIDRRSLTIVSPDPVHFQNKKSPSALCRRAFSQFQMGIYLPKTIISNHFGVNTEIFQHAITSINHEWRTAHVIFHFCWIFFI